MHLVLEKQGQYSRIRLMPNGALVRKDAITWSVASPHRHKKAVQAINKTLLGMYVGGLVYQQGALYAASPEEVALIVRGVLGDEDSTVRRMDRTAKIKWAIAVTAAAACGAAILLWVLLKLSLFLMLIPVAIWAAIRILR